MQLVCNHKHNTFINISKSNILADCMSEKPKRMKKSLISEGFCSFRVLSARGNILPKSSRSIMVAGANCIHPPRNKPRAPKHNIYSRAYLTYKQIHIRDANCWKNGYIWTHSWHWSWLTVIVSNHNSEQIAHLHLAYYTFYFCYVKI